MSCFLRIIRTRNSVPQDIILKFYYCDYLSALLSHCGLLYTIKKNICSSVNLNFCRLIGKICRGKVDLCTINNWYTIRKSNNWKVLGLHIKIELAIFDSWINKKILSNFQSQIFQKFFVLQCRISGIRKWFITWYDYRSLSVLSLIEIVANVFWKINNF